MFVGYAGWSAGQLLVNGREALIGPFQPYFWATGTRQSWRMYGVVDRRSARLEIHVLEGTWQPAYVDLTEHDWQGTLLRQERLGLAELRRYARLARERDPVFRRVFGTGIRSYLRRDFHPAQTSDEHLAQQWFAAHGYPFQPPREAA